VYDDLLKLDGILFSNSSPLPKLTGKSLQVVTLVHTVLNHPHLRPPGDNAANQFIHTILLIVPVNTIANWNNEFDLWTGKLEQSVRVFDISEVRKEARLKVVRTWSQRGGVLLIGSDLYASLIKNNKGLSEVSLICGTSLIPRLNMSAHMRRHYIHSTSKTQGQTWSS
jgi:SNF2 family DNA or RNA helicase